MPKLFYDDNGVSVIVGALLLILIVVIAAAGLAMIVSQAEKNYSDRQAQENAIKNENLKITSIKPVYDVQEGNSTFGNLKSINITIQNINIDDAKIGQISLNDVYASKYQCDGKDYDPASNWLTVPASKTVIIQLIVNTTDFDAPPVIENTDQIKVQVSTSYYNFFDNTFKPPVASAKFDVNTESLGLVQRDFVMLDGSDSSDETGKIKIYQWDIQDYSQGFGYNISSIVTSGNKIRFTPPTNGPFEITLTVKDNQFDANAMIGKTSVIDIPADPNFCPPLTLSAVYYLNNTTVMAKLKDASGNPCPGKLVTFQPGSNVIVNQSMALTDVNGIAVANVSFSGSTIGTVTVSYDKLTTNIQVSALTRPPEANFNSYSTNPNSGDTVQFYDTSDHGTGGSITSWVWDFGDGYSNNNSANPTHIYINSGSSILKFTVTLTVTNSAGISDPMAKTDYISVKPAKPVAGFTAVANGSGTHALDFTGTNTGGPADTWTWNFGDGFYGNTQNVTHPYASNKSYTVVLTVTGLGGNSQSIQVVLAP